jgi:hypothetical protein
MTGQRRLPLRMAVLGLALAWPVLGGATGATAAPTSISNLQAGYWATAFPALVTTPSDGLRVSSNLAGPQAVSAIRFDTRAGETAVLLTLTVAQARPSSAQVALTACPPTPATAAWAPPEGAGAFADRPIADCAVAQSPGELSADGKSITVDLTGLAGSDGTVNVVLVPTGSQTFDVAFEPPAPESVTTVTSGASSSGSDFTVPPGGGSGTGGGSGAEGGETSPQAPAAEGSFEPVAELDGPTITGSLPQPLAVVAPPVLSANPPPVSGEVAQQPFGLPAGQQTALSVPTSNATAERAVLFALLAVGNAAVLVWHLRPRRLRTLPLVRTTAPG